MIGRSKSNSKKLILSLLFFAGIVSALFSQTTINGIINQYGHVTGIGTDYVIVPDPIQFAQFAAPDTVLLIQMKGARIYSTEDVSFGSPENSYGKPGKHEFLIIQSVEVATNKIIFRNNINNAFNVDGALQIIKVPSYNSAVVDISDLTCASWDSTSKTGGVLTMIVGRTLLLNKNIVVSGNGFIGGAISSGTGLCIESDAVNLDKFVYNSSFTNSGFKGESLVTRGYLAAGDYPPIYPEYAKGKGANLTGGGGGNGRFSGGGGGANYGAGGKGGLENNDCAPLYGRSDGGRGGKQLKITAYDGDIFLGGGGGSSTYLGGPTSSPGGNGAGIVIIICDTLKGNGKSILAEGFSTTPATLNAGSGGGGAGGSVAIYLQSFSTSAITISANGGKGGNNAGQFGEGGGGGGGLIKISNITIPAIVTRNVFPGGKGTGPVSPTAGNGAIGGVITTFVPLLNGFLFNSIRSSVTGDQVDSICSNVIPKEINGTLPVGGSGFYTYLWQKSYNFLGPEINIPLSNLVNYLPSATEADTVWFRRIVQDDVTLLTDTSKWVEIRVQTAVAGNLVGKDTTICYNQNPISLIPLNTGPSNGNGSYAYRWVQNLTNANWDTSPDATGTIINPGYDPPALTNTTYYKRVVISGRCIDYSPAVTITVLPLITGNITTRPDSVICEGSLFNNLGASAAGGGDLIYKYQWQDSIASSVWKPAVGTNINTTYVPDTSTFSVIEQRFLRRVVFSGPDSVCKSGSLPILLTRYHKIKNNSILADQTICSGIPPASLSGSTPVQGSGVYTFAWQDSSTVSSWITRGTTDFSFPPPALTDTTWYRRIVNSSKCTNTSLSVRIDVHRPILNNNISLLAGGLTDTTICNGQVPHLIKGTVATGGTDIPGDYAYQWLFSLNNITWNLVPVAGTGINYQPLSLTATSYFKRQVISGTCTVISSATITVTVLPLITNNIISANQIVCYNTVPLLLTGAPLAGGAGAGSYLFLWEESPDGTIWTAASGTNNSPAGSYLPPALTIPMKYKRTVTSGVNGCCTSISNVIDITIHPPLPTGAITSIADTTICEGSKVRLKISLTGVPNWNISYKENSANSPFIKIAGTDTTLLVSPVAGSALDLFTYSLFEVKDKFGCSATSLTGTRKADVYKVPVAYAGPDAMVCGPTVTLNAIRSAGTGIWYEQSVFKGTTETLTVTVDSTFSTGNDTHTYSWEETNWLCKNKDSVIITFYKRITSINAGADTTLFSFDNIIHMVADNVTKQTGETGLWTVVSGTGDFYPDTSNLAEVRNLSKGNNTFLWTITNGQCSRQDEVNIVVTELSIPEGFSPNNDPENYNNTFIIKGLDLPNQKAELIVINGAGTEVFSTSNRNEQVWTDWDGKNSNGHDLPEGTYYYLLKITSNGNDQVFKKSGFIVLKRY